MKLLSKALKFERVAIMSTVLVAQEC